MNQKLPECENCEKWEGFTMHNKLYCMMTCKYRIDYLNKILPKPLKSKKLDRK